MEILTLNNLNNAISERINASNLYKLLPILEDYVGIDWKQHINFCDKKYHRNRLFCGSEFEIILICWKKGQKSGIHDHPTKGCLMKILEGNLNETKFNLKKSLSRADEDTGLGLLPNYISCKSLMVHDVSYICGSDGLHNIEALDNSISLHIYSPPQYTPKFYEST